MRTFSANEFSIVVSVFSIDRRYSFSGSGFRGSEVEKRQAAGFWQPQRAALLWWFLVDFNIPQSEICNHMDLSSVN
jgi:hypothetical protein